VPAEYPRGLCDERLLVGARHVLENLERNRQVDSGAPQRKAGGVRAQKRQIGTRVATCAPRDAGTVQPDGGNERSTLRQQRRSITGTRGDVESDAAGGKPPRQEVAVEVLIGDPRSALARYESFAGEFDHVLHSGSMRSRARASQSPTRSPCGPA